MFAGKSEELIRRLTRAQYARQSVVAVKPLIDQRYSAQHVASHSGQRYACSTVEDSVQLLAHVAAHDPQVVGIEEAQFFDPGLVDAVRKLCAAGRHVICAGLQLDALARPFGCMPQLLALADEITVLTAVCVICGQDATRSQLIVDGEPAPWREGPFVHVGGHESYEARCVSCHRVPAAPWLTPA